MTEAKSEDIQRENSLKDLKGVIKTVIKTIDFCIINLPKDKKHKKLKDSLVKIRPVLIEKRNSLIDIISGVDDVDIQIEVIRDANALITASLLAGFLTGERYKTKYITERVKMMLQGNTLNARRAALKNSSPLKEQKKDITVDLARSYIANNPNRELTRNAIMTQIRSDIERKCKAAGIKPPGQTSIWNYLEEVSLP
jgi:hypothetical protein